MDAPEKGCFRNRKMKISVVIPVFNEEEVIPILKERLEGILHAQPFDYEVIIVDDGSKDNTANRIKGWIAANPKVILLELSRNFGHQPAITSGLSEAMGDAVVVMDADLQDPPEIIPQMVERWKNGNKIVLAERTARRENILRRMLFQCFYKFFAFISDMPVSITSGVFGLMDRVVVDHFLSLRERNRFIPGLRGWLGFKTDTIWYTRQDRVKGEAKQSIKKLLRYGLDAIFSFSYKPLRVSFFFGLFISTLCFLYGFILIILRLCNINLVQGFTTVAAAVFFIGGVILISNGIIGEYLGRIYDEVKRRPLFIIARKVTRKAQDKEVSIQDYGPIKER